MHFWIAAPNAATRDLGPSARRHVGATGTVGLVLAAGFGITACSSGYDAPTPSVGLRDGAPRLRTARASSGGGYKIGAPYSIGGVWYVPHEDPGYDRVGIASWYGADFQGRPTANGETYDLEGLTAAHPTLPLPSYVTVTNLANGRTILVRVNDRGPYVGSRMIDLTRASARALGYERNGTAQVRVRYVGRAPLDGNQSREWQYLQAQPWYQPGVMAQSRGSAVAGTSGWLPRWSLDGPDPRP